VDNIHIIYKGNMITIKQYVVRVLQMNLGNERDLLTYAAYKYFKDKEINKDISSFKLPPAITGVSSDDDHVTAAKNYCSTSYSEELSQNNNSLDIDIGTPTYDDNIIASFCDNNPGHKSCVCYNDSKPSLITYKIEMEKYHELFYTACVRRKLGSDLYGRQLKQFKASLQQYDYNLRAYRGKTPMLYYNSACCFARSACECPVDNMVVSKYVSNRLSKECRFECKWTDAAILTKVQTFNLQNLPVEPTTIQNPVPPSLDIGIQCCVNESVGVGSAIDVKQICNQSILKKITIAASDKLTADELAADKLAADKLAADNLTADELAKAEAGELAKAEADRLANVEQLSNNFLEYKKPMNFTLYVILLVLSILSIFVWRWWKGRGKNSKTNR
jgi:hypothetical protein